jgi:hypothetical protein
MKIGNMINTILTTISNIRAEYKARVAENHKALIRGGVLDHENHPSLDMKAN